MKTNLFSVFKTILFFVSLAITLPPSMAQITINASDVLDLIGTTHSTEEDSSDIIMVDVGQPGENQTWDFRNINLNRVTLGSIAYLAPSNTPYASNFPEANLAQQLTFDELDQGALYLYNQVTNEEIKSLGTAVDVNFMGIDTVLINKGDRTFAPLPLTYGSTWTTTEIDTTFNFPPIVLVNIDTIVNTVDAWGTIRLPGGDLPCLRIRMDEKSISSDFLGNPVITTTISYFWITAANLISLNVTSKDGETNPNFTEAAYLSVITSGTVPVFDVDQNSSELLQNAPNPFKTETVINYEVEKAGLVDLSVFDQQGKKISTLVTGTKLPGKYQVVWNGNSTSGQRLPSGTYFYKMNSETTNAIRSMILLE